MLRWTIARDVKENVSCTISARDPLLGVVSTYASFLTDIRYVRNHIVHKNTGTRVNFRKVVRGYFGGLKRGMTPGLLLLTTARRPMPLVRTYFSLARALVGDLVRA